MNTPQRKIDAFCRTHPRFGIPNLMMMIIGANVIIFILDMFSQGYASAMLSFNLAAILKGQVWRIVTFVLVPSQGSGSIFSFALFAFFYGYMGTMLERFWGTGKFTLFVLIGALLSALAGFACGYASMYFIFFSMFFAMAVLYPDMTVYIMFIIPFKAKWVAWINAAVFLYQIILPISQGVPAQALLPLAALLNYFLLFSGDISYYIGRNVTLKRAKHQNSRKTVDFKNAQKHAREKKGYLHKCAVCGRTDVTNPELEFRYCSKCNGYYCYCSEHINSHVHVE